MELLNGIKLFESFKSQKEIEKLANDILKKSGEKTYEYAIGYKEFCEKRNKNCENPIINISTVYFKDIDSSKYNELKEFLKEDLYITFTKENEYTTNKGGYSKDSMINTSYIDITYSKEFYEKINEGFKEGNIDSGSDIYFQLFYETESTLIHELQHAYDDWRSNGKALRQSHKFNYDARKRRYIIKKKNRGVQLTDEEIDFLLKHSDYYYNLPHEIDARFTQAVKEIKPLSLDFENKIWYMKMSFEEYFNTFKLYFKGWDNLNKKSKKRIARKLGQFYELEKDYAKEKTEIYRKKD